MRLFLLILVSTLFLTIAALRQPLEIRYVALGDSYTAGTGVNQEDSLPEQLSKKLNDKGVKIRLVANLAKNSKATTEIISEQLPEFNKLSPTFATLLVGVNDFNRGYPKESFQKNLGTILDQMTARLPKNRLIVLTIPDFSVTPVGKTFGDPAGNSKGIREFNGIIRDETAKRNLPVVDVYTLSQEMGKDYSLMAHDQLHPSAKEYALWVREIVPVVLEMLKR